MVQVSAPAGSGKTFLLRSWIAAEGLEKRVAWVSVGRGERDPQAFWVSVLDSLRGTCVGAERVRELTAAPDLDGATVVRRLLEDLSSLDERLWLVIDDLHELRAQEAIDQVELLLGSAPPQLRVLLLARRDVRLGLHRLRLEGELTEIRGEDLSFSVGESRALLAAAGARLSDGALESLVARTEGWAAGLRLAALSLVRDRDPERFATTFSGRERVVAECLLAEVLERQPEDVSRLLLRTSILDRVSGPLADRLTGSSGSYRILAQLEDAGAFVVSLDPATKTAGTAGSQRLTEATKRPAPGASAAHGETPFDSARVSRHSANVDPPCDGYRDGRLRDRDRGKALARGWRSARSRRRP